MLGSTKNAKLSILVPQFCGNNRMALCDTGFTVYKGCWPRCIYKIGRLIPKSEQ